MRPVKQKLQFKKTEEKQNTDSNFTKWNKNERKQVNILMHNRLPPQKLQNK